jgi:hypothetical protein
MIAVACREGESEGEEERHTDSAARAVVTCRYESHAGSGEREPNPPVAAERMEATSCPDDDLHSCNAT